MLKVNAKYSTNEACLREMRHALVGLALQNANSSRDANRVTIPLKYIDRSSNWILSVSNTVEGKQALGSDL